MRDLSYVELKLVNGGPIEPPPPEEPPPTERGDNGWGNGSDGTNAGSDAGGTALSKMATVSVPPGQINTNPTDSTGR
jgi:hypothetical protein